ncbi:MAG: hypothetical protein EOO42_14225 [Flavobacteriales bacterium]|nr:MAG: hypothetical protein EOO42_14225 [Flavobacteriales bacterium]
MNTYLLTEEEYNSTFSDKMIDVTTTADPVVDIWLYVEQLVIENVVDQEISDNGLVELVYRNLDNTFDHVLLPTSNKNVFTVIIIDILNKLIKGHYFLDLNEKYSLN